MDINFRGIDIIRGRDCTIFIKGDTYAVTVDSALLANGWVGGQGVQWVDSDTDERVVTYSKGLYGGILIWGSDEQGDRYTAMTQQQLVYSTAVMMVGRGLISTLAYEKYTYASRLMGPLVPIVYMPHDILYLSLRGYWTNEDELTLSSDPLAPCFFTGFVAQVPKVNNQFQLGIQTSM